MMLKRFTLILISSICLFLTNCEESDTCNCFSEKEKRFDIEGIHEFTHWKNSENKKYQIYNTIEGDNQIQFDHYKGFSLSFLTSTYYQNETESMHPEENNCACDSAVNVGSVENYKDIKVVTMNDFSREYRKNDTINNIIKLSYRNPVNKAWRIDTFIESTELTGIDKEYLIFHLTQPPTINQTFQARVIIKIVNKRNNEQEVYKKQTPPITFKN